MTTSMQSFFRLLPWFLAMLGLVGWLFAEYGNKLPAITTGFSVDNLPTGGIQNIFSPKSNCPPTQPTAEVAPCTFKMRVQKLQETCKSDPPPRVNSVTTSVKLQNINKNVGPALGSVWLDRDRKTLGCIMPKVASTSWVTYMIEHSGNPKAALNNFEAVPLSELNTIYADWTKYIIVKHPLQRLISAYYEVVTRRHLFHNISLDVFVGQLAFGEIYDLNPHWVMYSSWCYPCDVKYDFILRVETLDHDLPLFNKAVGMPKDAQMSVKNPNTSVRGKTKAADNPFSYDKVIRDLYCKHPDVIEKLLEIYRHDFEMFGYHWNSTTLSTCAYRNSENQCC